MSIKNHQCITAEDIKHLKQVIRDSKTEEEIGSAMKLADSLVKKTEDCIKCKGILELFQNKNMHAC